MGVRIDEAYRRATRGGPLEPPSLELLAPVRDDIPAARCWAYSAPFLQSLAICLELLSAE
jgi:hypothetical protein